MLIRAVRARDPATIAARAAQVAQWAAARAEPTVFRSPVATFASADSASMDNMANGLAITVDVDNADPREALRVLRAVHGLGEPTVVTIMTGSVGSVPRPTSPCPSGISTGA